MLDIQITVNDADQKVLENDLLDVQQWVQDAVDGKINSCWKRFQQEWTARLMADPSFTDPIPSNKAAFIELVTSLPEYKNRAQRDAEAAQQAPQE